MALHLESGRGGGGGGGWGMLRTRTEVEVEEKVPSVWSGPTISFFSPVNHNLLGAHLTLC